VTANEDLVVAIADAVCDGAPVFCMAGGPQGRYWGAKREAAECEQVIDVSGNSEQKTTTGPACYRARSNILPFTNGFDHWALTTDGLVH
jgi:hypothetical protein